MNRSFHFRERSVDSINKKWLFHSGWQPANNRYRIPIAGTWVLTLSVGEHPDEEGSTFLNARDWLSKRSDGKMTQVVHELHHYVLG